MNFFRHLLLEGEPASALAGGGQGDPAPAGGDPAPAGDPTPDSSIYGDLTVQWPEGFDNQLANEPSLKAFVDKESGAVNMANVLKSYVHTKKQVGADRVTIPGEHATAQELDEFYSKLGYNPDAEAYVLNKGEESLLTDEVSSKFKELAMQHRIPADQAQKFMDFMEGTVKGSRDSMTEATANSIKEGLDGLKTEWGGAYDTKLSSAQRVLKEVIKDESVTEALKDPRLGSNPAIIKTLAAIGDKLFKEDGFSGQSNPTGAMTPAEAQTEINDIMGDRKHPYWNKDHPGHLDAVSKMNKLYTYRNGGRS